MGLWLAVVSRNAKAMRALIDAHDSLSAFDVACSRRLDDYIKRIDKAKSSFSGSADADVPPGGKGDDTGNSTDAPLTHADVGHDGGRGEARNDDGGDGDDDGDDDPVVGRYVNAESEALALASEALGPTGRTRYVAAQLDSAMRTCFRTIPGETAVSLAEEVDIGMVPPSSSEKVLRRLGAAALDPLALVASDVLCERRYARCVGEMLKAADAYGDVKDLAIRIDGRRHAGGGTDLLDLERCVAACDAAWHSGPDVLLEASSADPDTSGDDLADCRGSAADFAAWASMSPRRVSAAYAFMRRALGIGRGGTAEAAWNMARKALSSTPPDPGARGSALRAGEFGRVGRVVADCVSALVWSVSQTPLCGDEHALRIAARAHDSMATARYPDGWRLILEALATHGDGAADRACRAVRFHSLNLGLIAFDALSAPGTWTDPLTKEMSRRDAPDGEGATAGRSAKRSSDGDDDDILYGYDMPPVRSLMHIALAHPEVSLDPAYALGMARIMACLLHRCDGLDGESIRSSASSAYEIFMDERDGRAVLLFDAPLWAAALVRFLDEGDDARTAWLHEISHESVLERARAFARSVCSARAKGHITLDPPHAVDPLMQFSAGAIDAAQLDDQLTDDDHVYYIERLTPPPEF
jgi:hypothetical protein